MKDNTTRDLTTLYFQKGIHSYCISKKVNIQQVFTPFFIK